MEMTVKFGADLQLEAMARKFLALNDTEEPIRYEAERAFEENIIEVSLEATIKARKIETVYDPTDLWITDLSFTEEWGATFEAEDYDIRIGDRILKNKYDDAWLQRREVQQELSLLA